MSDVFCPYCRKYVPKERIVIIRRLKGTSRRCDTCDLKIKAIASMSPEERDKAGALVSAQNKALNVARSAAMIRGPDGRMKEQR